MIAGHKSPLRRQVLSLALATAAIWQLAVVPGFCGGISSTPPRAVSPVAQNGWRLDMMEVGSKGIGQLVIHEGYFLGEKALVEIMSKNGYRYRMRATDEETAAGIEVPPITQVGPVKFRLYEMFGGSCLKPGQTRPEGYRGCAGAAGWDTDVIVKGAGFALSK
mmetsp:Transcript_11289/g.12578  ORF Transcript_11289/g.12578 Transcript_11289/m.12578 type:complete len:163 (-) Transcript_11289:235-723(-)